MSRFLDALHSGRVLLMDGAMGTELQRAGLTANESAELWNLRHPERVRRIHQLYVDAGAECLLTNTLQANPEALAEHGAEAKLEQVVQAAVDLARAAAGGARFVLGDVGPVAKPDLLVAERLANAFRGVDAFLLETLSEAEFPALFLEALHNNRRVTPVLISFAFCPSWKASPGLAASPQGYRTLQALSPEHCAERANAAAALGVNCGVDMSLDKILHVLRRYRTVTNAPLFARPNAGTPTRRGNEWRYALTPDALAARLPELLAAGATMIGGCCGTTPAHIAALRQMLDSL